MAGQESMRGVPPGRSRSRVADVLRHIRLTSQGHWFAAVIAFIFVALQLPAILQPLLPQLQASGFVAASAAIRLVEVAGFVLLAAYLIIGMADQPFERYRALFLASLLIVNLRMYVVVLLPGHRLLSDALGLFALHLVFASQVAAVPEPGRSWSAVARALLTLGLSFLLILDLAVQNGMPLAIPSQPPVSLAMVNRLYELVFALASLGYVVLLLALYRRSARASLDVGVKWRFWFLIGAAFWYTLLYLYEFARRTGSPPAPDTFWTNVFAAMAIMCMLAAFLMPRWLEGFLLWLQDRVLLGHLHNDLIFLAGFISEKLPSAQDHTLVQLSGLVAERLSFSSHEKQVLRTAAGLVVLARPRTWANVGFTEGIAGDEKIAFRFAAEAENHAWSPIEYPGRPNVARKYRNRLAMLRRVAVVLRYYERWWPHLEAGRRPWAGRLLLPREVLVLLLVHLFLRQKNNHRGVFPHSMVEALGSIFEKGRESAQPND